MNERIKELWENCDDIQVVYPRQGSPIYASPELLEKFAELIVRECSTLAYDGPNGILEHFGFGVEE